MDCRYRSDDLYVYDTAGNVILEEEIPTISAN